MKIHIGFCVYLFAYMNITVPMVLNTTPDQQARLQALQRAFAQVCNALGPLVQANRCWNRVALHHLAYRQLRERFPEVGSQMVCNAIYSVSRAARLVYQHPQSPFNVGRGGGVQSALPLLQFLPAAPVFFDRHTLSMKQNQLSMYTLDGRMRFQLTLPADQVALFEQSRLREVVLSSRPDGQFVLTFMLTDAAAGEVADGPEAAELPLTQGGDELGAAVLPWPSYLKVEETT